MRKMYPGKKIPIPEWPTLLRFTVKLVSHYCLVDVRGYAFTGKASVMKYPGIFTAKRLEIMLLKPVIKH